MKTRVLLLVAASAVFVGLFAGRVSSQEKTDQERDQDREMKAFMKAGMVTEHHERLKAMVGSWKVTSKFWSAPDAKPVISHATAERRMVMGDRFLMELYHGKVMGMPFEGMGLTGYDNLKKKYTSMWVDTTSTAIITSLGTGDASGEVITFIGQYDDPMTGNPKKYRMTSRVINKDKDVAEMYEIELDGYEFKSFQMVYTRATGKMAHERRRMAPLAIGRNGPIAKALEAYRWDIGEYPRTHDGLKALFQPPRRADFNLDRYRGPYMEGTFEDLQDPWGNPFGYRCSGAFGDGGYDLWSYGPDGVDDGGADGSDDIKNRPDE